MDRDVRPDSEPFQTAYKNARNEHSSGSHGMRDDLLIKRIRGGETELFQELIHPYLRAVFSLVRAVLNDHADAEDTVQESALLRFQIWISCDRAMRSAHGCSRLRSTRLAWCGGVTPLSFFQVPG